MQSASGWRPFRELWRQQPETTGSTTQQLTTQWEY